MGYAQALQAQHRLIILRTLMQDLDREMGEGTLNVVLEHFDVNLSREDLRLMLDWLATVDVVTIDKSEKVWFVTLSDKGAELMRGKVQIDGIAHPRDVL